MEMNEQRFNGLEQNNRTFQARKKPVEVDVHGPVDQRMKIHTREGTVIAEPGDYVIRGIDGEVYPIDADIFEDTYEVLHEN